MNARGEVVLQLPRGFEPFVQLGKKAGDIAFLRGHGGACAFDERRRETEAGGDVETGGLARRAEAQNISGLQCFFIETHGAVEDAGRRGAVHLQRQQMRGGDGESAALAERIEHSHSERSAFFRIGGAAEFVEKDQRIGCRCLEHLMDVGDVSGEAAKAFLDGLVIADIGKYPIEQRELGAGGGDGQTGVGHEGEKAGGFHGDGFAAGVRTADEQGAAAFIEREGDGDDGQAMSAQHVFQQRMAGEIEDEAPCFRWAEHGDATVEIGGEIGEGEEKFQAAHDAGGGGDGGGLGVKASGEIGENAALFALLLVAEADEVVVQADRFERLDEESLAGAAGAVDDAIHFALLAGDDGNDEAVVANGDEVLAQGAVAAMGAEERFERGADGFLSLLDFAAKAAESHAGVVGQRSIGENLAGHRPNERAKIRQFGSGAGETGEAACGGKNDAAQLGGLFQEMKEGAELKAVEDGAFDADCGERRGRILDGIEADAAGRGAGSGLFLRGGDVTGGFGDIGQAVLDGGAIGGGSGCVELGAAERAMDVAGEERAQVFPLQEIRAGGLHGLDSRGRMLSR